MKTKRVLHEVASAARKKSGMVLVMVLGFMALMILSTVSLSTMIQQDVNLIRGVKEKEQARFAAEAGINHALARIDADGFALGTAATINSDPGLFDSGSYTVTFSEPVSDRHLITSTGTVLGVSRAVTVEVESEEAVNPATDYFSGAGGNISIKLHTNVTGAIITGDLHANGDVSLRVQNNAELTITGDVSATGTVSTVSQSGGTLILNGNTIDGAPVISFPIFDYSTYRTEAEDVDNPGSDDYYEGDQVFPSGLVTSSPANGIVYVNGNVSISGQCTINGGLIADNIAIETNSKLQQNKTAHNRNVIIARTGDIVVRGHLAAGEAIVYAKQDIYTHENWGPIIDISGSMIAEGDITMWNEKAIIYYNHVKQAPLDMTEESGTASVVSWNK
ncbi:MAG: hypothetical protein KJ995_03365 [Candidatus Omnitrophica bacterium]|nr:hypothetical protein [Candidatus Omnitrophota bacterium]MBU1127506.1 hypothetical protein [Candidatus Omnitrophota bacterium]MBU1657068.1 hypothetical protein [Candidatus Omnitrophota bacterium]MBU1783797.1 hypothetical protein [Candidatus Omnitrophota bacterium]MBU1851425.1 hypothetical protein [Candidatus Omnitrophota bacterium]